MSNFLFFLSLLLLILSIQESTTLELFKHAMNKGLYVQKEQPYFIPSPDTVLNDESNQYFHFDPTGNLQIKNRGIFNFKQIMKNESKALFKICSKSGKCLGSVTFCYLTNSETSETNFCPSGTNGIEFEMTRTGLLYSDPNIGLLEWAGSSCALFGYLNENVIIGPSYANFSLANENMEFQKLPDSAENQFIASLNFPKGCSIEPINAEVLIRTTSAIPKVQEENKNEAAAIEVEESTDLIFLLYIAAGIWLFIDIVFGILIIVAIILEKIKAKKERKREMEERIKAEAAVIAFEAKKRERERQKKERKEKLEKGMAKPIKHINTKSEKMIVETRPQKLFGAVKGAKENLPTESDVSKAKHGHREMKNESEPKSVSEKKPSEKSKKSQKSKKSEKSKKSKKDGAKIRATENGNLSLISQTSKIESKSKQVSSAVSETSKNMSNIKEPK